MSFTLSWTGAKGGESLEVETAAEALKEAESRIGRVPKLIIKDDRGVRLSTEDLYQIVYPMDDDEDA